MRTAKVANPAASRTAPNNTASELSKVATPSNVVKIQS
jgi:hypothetical protein